MSDKNCCEVPFTEQLRSIPPLHRLTIPIQWAEDGTETGHRFIPVGVMAHRAADRIEELEMLLNASRVSAKACSDCDPHIGERVRELERDNAALLAANKDCLAHFDSLKADYDALRRHADNMALAIECAEGFEARDLDFAFDYRQWSKGK